MLKFDQINDSVINTFAGSGIDAGLVVGRAHHTLPGTKPSGKRLSVAYLTTPTATTPRAGIEPVSVPVSQETWCQRQRPGMSCCQMSAAGQAPAAMWASLVLHQQTTL
ncbi:MAG: hypothetical protein R3C02_21915 [Planctomycetaceae bacterium]